jgi:hypothetical protein
MATGTCISSTTTDAVVTGVTPVSFRQRQLMQSRIVQVGRERLEIESLDELRALLSRASGTADSEIWIRFADGPRMCMLRNADRALLMFQTGDDDPGVLGGAGGVPVTSGTVRFMLSNGQQDEYPLAHTVTATRAVATFEYFFSTGALAPFVQWTPAGH